MTHTFENVLHYTQPLSVLYVEDDPDVRESMTDILSLLFSHIEVAENGKEGLEKFKTFYTQNQRHIDIVISDILMPVCDGIRMSKKILELNPDQEIIIISAQGDSTGLIEMINIGISHFIAKPIQDTRLFNALYHAGKRLSIIRERDLMTKEVHRLNKELEEKIKTLEKLAREDALTGIANRRFFYEKADALMEESKRTGSSLLLAVTDIDTFKQINDTYGHLVGDHVIIYTANILGTIIDDHSFLGRVGGDEFMMLFQGHSISSVLEKIHTVQEEIDREHNIKGASVHFTISIGISKLEEGDKTIDDVIQRADNNLYKAKNNGRNLIVY